MMALVLTRAHADACAAEAEAFRPLETGGLFLGVIDTEGRRLVEHVVGPGPAARRARTWLEVDEVWQNDRIAELASGRPDLLYLGEWHSHPEASDSRPSSVDRRTLLGLSRFEPLRCPAPVMVILHPGRSAGTWLGGAWMLTGGRRLWQFAPSVGEVDLVVA